MCEQRVDVAERALALPLCDHVGNAGEHGVHHVKRRGVEVRGPGGQLAQHDRREPRAGGRFLDEGADPGVELVLGRARAVGDSAHARTDGANHVADDFGIEPGLAAEVVVEHRLVDPGPGGDAFGSRRLVAALGELVRRGAEDGDPGVARGTSRHFS